MQKFLIIPSMVLAFSAPAVAQAPRPAATTEVCSQLATKYERLFKRMAFTFSNGLSDDSAPRETNRLLNATIVQLEGNSLIQLMSAHKCPMPSEVPSISPYLGKATACTQLAAKLRLATIKGQDISAIEKEKDLACNIEIWTRD